MAETDSNWKKPKEVENQHQDALVEIGKKLEKLRTDKNLTASGLAKELQISRNAYRQMEKGEIYFSTYNFLKVLDYHSVDIATFFSIKVEDL